MKKSYWLQGFLAGSVAGGLICGLLLGQRVEARDHGGQSGRHKFSISWPDSLDAVKAAPENHKIIFENSRVRILEVTAEPYVSEPVHTHQWPGIMWMADSNFSKARIMYYHCAYDPTTKKFKDLDSTLEKGPKANIGFEIPPEGLHRVSNLSNLRLTAYRVEFKN